MNYYDILALPSPLASRENFNEQDVKQAYHKALLRHHPDKHGSISSVGSPSAPALTIDDITIAYKVLSNPQSRSTYDGSLRAEHWRSELNVAKTMIRSEIIDLDDLEYDEEQGAWYRACRCGNDRGYLITEEELEREAEHGEIVTGCSGCSLWLKVSFQKVEGG